jgi:hypothetical protein
MVAVLYLTDRVNILHPNRVPGSLELEEVPDVVYACAESAYQSSFSSALRVFTGFKESAAPSASSFRSLAPTTAKTRRM